MSISLAISPCPNDTFGFYALLTGKVKAPAPLSTTLLDIENLNQSAALEKYDIIKMSAATFASVSDRYRLLKTGTAFGTKSGPLLIAKSKQIDLKNARLATPGKNTTAAHLYHLLFESPKEQIDVPYNTIIDLIEKGEVEAGIIIHESRFSLHKTKLKIVADLGSKYFETFSAPLPLGIAAVHNRIPKNLQHEIDRAIFSSFQYAKNHPQEALLFAQKFAQDKRMPIIRKHVRAFVTKETYLLEEKDIESIQHFFACCLNV